MKYITSQDFEGKEWQNKTAALDLHVQNASWFKNTEFNNECFYKIEVDKLKELWIYGCCIINQKTNLIIKVFFLDVNEETIGLEEKEIEINNKTFFLIKFDVNVENLKFVKTVFYLETNMPVELYIFSISDKKLFEVLEQDEIVSTNLIMWGSFGYGDFGYTTFGVAQQGGF